jgi:hypothetical protein
MPEMKAAEVAAAARPPSTPADRDRQVEVLIR